LPPPWYFLQPKYPEAVVGQLQNVVKLHRIVDIHLNRLFDKNFRQLSNMCCSECRVLETLIRSVPIREGKEISTMIFLYRQKQVSIFLSRPRVITPVAYVFDPQQAKDHHPKFDGG
jgi:hypothetical protein